MKTNYLVKNAVTDPYYNLALEEFLLLNYTQGTIVMLWQNANTIVVGRHQNTIEEINQKYVKEHGITVVRRSTGGGTVYHDMGNLNYSFITDRDEANAEGMRHFAGYILLALKQLGVRAEFSGRNDIVVGGKKVSGTAQRLYKDRILHHGCLLFNTDLTQVKRSLQVRPEKYESRGIKSVKSRVANIVQYLPREVSLQEFERILIDVIRQEGQLDTLQLSTEDKLQVEKIRREKYATWEWTFGNSINCCMHNFQRYDGGILEIYLEVRRGKLIRCQIYGDFMALCPVSEVANALVGCRYEYDTILTILDSFVMEDYFGSITKEQFLATILCAEE